ncbi:MAG: phosphatidylserine/phosphatidylglycerophosphate/cardiolipin synthase family protein [Archangium sp.]
MVGKIGSPNVPASIPSTKTNDAAAPAKAPEVAKTNFAVTAPTSKLDAPVASKSTAALDGVATRPAGVNTTVAVAFDSIKAPGGPAKARILDDGLDAWNARMDMIENAKTSIDSSYFIVEKDPFGYAFLGGLLKKQLEGVPVRLSIDAMADTFGTHGFKAPLKGKDFLQEIVNHGGEAYVYHPVYERPLDALKGDYSVLASNHDKILVADGKIGVTGGRNIAQDYYANPKDLKGAWRDMDVLVEGPGPAAGLKEAFEAELKNGNASKPVHKDLLGNWDKKDIQLLGAYEMMNAWLKAPALSEDQKTALRADPGARDKLAAELVSSTLVTVQKDLPEKLRREPSKKDLEFLNEQAKALVSHLEARGSRAHYDAGTSMNHQTEVKIIDQTSAAAGQRVNNMAPALTALVEGAKKRIVIENPYVVLTQDMMGALQRAADRGVKIDIITNSPLSTDSDVTQAFFLEDWKMILARCPDAHIYVATGDRKFHTKSAIIDDDETVVSTYNLDLLSGFVNGEVGAVVKSKELATDLTAAFEHDKADPANGFIEYKIQRDADGKAVLKDGQPISVFGPEDHLPKDVLEKYAKKRNLWGNFVRNHVPQFKPLRHDDQ